ncbi:MAG: D-Ala-D-Ala carboxypeptidase family metallohydrolase [Paludibacter sp.]
MNFQLSKNFSLTELCITDSQLPNLPEEKQIDSLKALATDLLQPARDLLGNPIHVSSGFRSLAVNKEKGGSMKPLSQHCKGEAADLETFDNAALFNLVRHQLDFDQLIWEGGDDHQPSWVHISYKASGNRKQVLRMKMVGGKKSYTNF